MSVDCNGIRQPLTRGAGNWLFTRWIDWNYDQLVTIIECLRKFFEKTLSSSVPVRLKHDYDSTVVGTPSCGKRCTNFGRMMPIVVDEYDAVEYGRDRETASHAIKIGQRMSHDVIRNG